MNALVSKMTLEEKIDYIGGTEGFFIRAVPRVGLKAFKMADGPIGVRNFGPATTMAGGISLAATWNPSLAEKVGIQIGGGGEGTPGDVILNAGSDREERLPSKFPYRKARAGDRLRLIGPSGGGYGDPADRDPALLREDVADGYVSEAAAGERYRRR